MKSSVDCVRTLQILLAGGLVALACSSNNGGSESNFQKCDRDSECASGVCASGRCSPLVEADAGSGGSGGLGGGGIDNHTVAGGNTGLGGADAGFGGAVSGGTNAGGTFCNAGGAFVFSGGFYGAGGSYPGAGGQTPTCPVDGSGVATEDPAVFCNDFACPDTAASVLKGLTCNTEGTGDITLTVGCGVQKLHLSGNSLQYSAWIDLTQGKFVAAEATEPSPFGACNTTGYRTGTVPADCADAKTYACRRTVPITECRSPKDPGCSVCCTEYGGYCNINAAGPTSNIYDWGTGVQGSCPCNCPVCASCNPDSEQALRTFPAHPECGCPAEPPPAPDPNGSGGAPGAGGTGGDPCPNICGYKAELQRACPGITP